MIFAIVTLISSSLFAWVLMHFNLWLCKPVSPNKHLIFLDFFFFIVLAQISKICAIELGSLGFFDDLTFIAAIFFLMIYCAPKWGLYKDAVKG